MPERVTLAALARAARLLSLSAVAEAAGLNRQSLHTRLRRGGPELSDAEAVAVTQALTDAGLRLTPPHG